MGNSYDKHIEGFVEFNRKIKDEVKRKSVYQYQIAHFKMLTQENSSLPSFQNITETKIMKIKNVKRLQDLERVYESIAPVDDDKEDAERVKDLEDSNDVCVNELRAELDSLMKNESEFNEAKQKLSKLMAMKNALERKKQEYEMKLKRSAFARTYSMKLLNWGMQRVIAPKIHEINKKGINRNLIRCIKRIENIEKVAEHMKTCKLYEVSNKISGLQGKIALLKKEKEELIMLRNLDNIEEGFESSISQISKEVNVIRMEYERVIKLNDLLSNELLLGNSS